MERVLLCVCCSGTAAWGITPRERIVSSVQMCTNYEAIDQGQPSKWIILRSIQAGADTTTAQNQGKPAKTCAAFRVQGQFRGFGFPEFGQRD
jgi:hypothetical protein